MTTDTELPGVTHEEWLIACAAWNNIEPDKFAEMCAKNEQRMPIGSRLAWARVFEAVRDMLRGTPADKAAADVVGAAVNFVTGNSYFPGTELKIAVKAYLAQKKD